MWQEFWEKLQSADEGRKKFWMVITVGVLMVVVVYIWLAYFNNLLASLSQPVMVTAVQGGSREFSFWETMKSGTATIFDGLKGIFNHPKEYIIKP